MSPYRRSSRPPRAPKICGCPQCVELRAVLERDELVDMLSVTPMIRSLVELFTLT